MTREKILQTFSDINRVYNNSTKYDTLKSMLDDLLEGLLESMKSELQTAYNRGYKHGFEDGKPVTPNSETEQFVKWVAIEIFDDMWEYNKDAFAELACRKLEKLGIVRAKGDEWELVESNCEESEDEIESEEKNGKQRKTCRKK